MDDNPFIVQIRIILPLTIIITFIISIVTSFVMYKCAYKKPGTRLLSTTLFVGFLYIPLQLYNLKNLQTVKNIFASTGLEVLVSTYTFLQIFSILTLLYYLVWYYFSYQLRKLNYKLQFEDIVKIPSYKEVFKGFLSVDNRKNLELSYKEAKRKHPTISKHLKKKYNERKKQLTEKKTA